MTLYEICYLILVSIQTGFLIWYAFETYKLRQAAFSQAETIAKQYGEMATQSKLLAQQVALNTQALEYQQQSTITEADAVFDFGVIHNTSSSLAMMIHSLKKNIVFTEFRSSQTIQIRPTTPPNEHKLIIWMPNTVAVVYVGIKYKTRLDEMKGQVFSIDTATGNYKAAKDYDIDQLLVYKG
jgi:hypothetical protein